MSARETLMKGERKRRGVLGVLLVLCALIAAAALAMEFSSGARGAWIGAQPGARFVIGVGAAAFAVIAAYAARFILARSEGNGESDAGDHA